MLTNPAMPEALRIKLKYNGPTVDDGTMPVEDVVDALEGFSGAYGKIASRVDPEEEHQLRVAALRTGSFELVILSWIATQAQNVESVKSVVDAAKWIYGSLKWIITAKKHIKGKPYDFHIEGDGNTVVVVNADGASLGLPPAVFELFRSRLVGSDLNKIAAPLTSERVDSAEIYSDDDPEPVTITAEERESFSSQSQGGSKIDTEVVGIFVSLNKERDNGTFKLGNGRNVRYRYVGESPENMHMEFSHRGAVRVKCTATLDENLEVQYVEIRSIERLQRSLPLPPHSPLVH